MTPALKIWIKYEETSPMAWELHFTQVYFRDAQTTVLHQILNPMQDNFCLEFLLCFVENYLLN